MKVTIGLDSASQPISRFKFQTLAAIAVEIF